MSMRGWAVLMLLAACGGDGGPTEFGPGEISCDIDDVSNVFANDLEGSVDDDGMLVLGALRDLVSRDTVELRIHDKEGDSDLADPFAGAYLAFTLELDAFTSQTLLGTATATLITDDRAQGTFVAEVVNGADPNDVRVVTNGEFDVPLTR